MSQIKANKKTTKPPSGSSRRSTKDVDDAPKTSTGKPLDHPDRKRLPPLLRLAWYSLNQAFRRRISHLKITPDQFTILRWLTECDPDWPTQRELGAMMASDPNTITSLLKRMEAAKVVERKPHETDKRANRIMITALGKTKYKKARQVAIDLQTEVLGTLPAAKRDEFFHHLEMLAQACRETLDGPPPRDGE